MTETSDPAQNQFGIPPSGEDGMPKRFGKYTLLRRLATGGMAELFLALQKSVAGFEKLIVIKRILPSMNTNEAFIDMLLHEARIAATLTHPNVVQIYDVGWAEGAYYIAMEHIHGEDLRSIVQQMKARQLSQFPMEHALAIVIGLCAGLAYAHEKRGLDDEPLQIVHRDISPQNVIVTYSGDIKVVDFGIAKSGDRIGEDTKSGRLKGKVRYMSPEQAQGEIIDWRSDIFSVGIILFELTTGKRLFKGRNELETLRLICDRSYPRPRQVHADYPQRLDEIVMKALAKDRSERYQSARLLQADLEAYIREERIAASTLSLRDWMEDLFTEKLAQQKEALHDVKQLADIIAVQNQTALDNADTAYSMLPPASSTSSDINIPRHKTRLPAVIGAMVLGMAAASAGGYFLVRSFKTPEALPTATALTPTTQKGTIQILTTPPGAAIWINGSLRSEKSPATIDDLPLHTPIDLKLTLEGFTPIRQQVQLESDDEPLRIEKVLETGTATLVVTTNAPGARVFIGGKIYDSLRIEELVADEELKVTLSAPGYAPRTTKVRIGPNETKTLNLNLEREDLRKAKAVTEPAKSEPAGGNGKLNVSSRGGYCTVAVGGQSYGSTPVGGIVLPAGNHLVRCKPTSGPEKSMGVTIRPDQVARITFTLDG